MAAAAVADDVKTIIIIDNYYYIITLPKRIYRVLIIKLSRGPTVIRTRLVFRFNNILILCDHER